MAQSLGLGDAILDGAVREAGLRPRRHEGADSKDLSGEHQRGLHSGPPQGRKEAGMAGGGGWGAQLCKPHYQPGCPASKGGSRWSPDLDPSVSFLCGQLGDGSNVPPAQRWGTQWGNRRETGKWYLFFSLPLFFSGSS